MNVTAVRTYHLEWDEEEMATLYRILDWAKDTIILLPEPCTEELQMIEQLQNLRYSRMV
jgi:hypothetical protein